jgi:hypothetical protein
LIQNGALGGYAASYRATADGSLVVAATTGFDNADFGPVGNLVLWNGSVGPPMTAPEQRPFDVTVCPTGHVVVAEARRGVRVFDSAGAELTDRPLDIGLPPVPNGLICY